MTKAPRKPRRDTTEKVLKVRRDTIAQLIANAGGQKKLGDTLGVSQAAVSKWLIRGWLPLPRAAEVEAIYGVPRTETANPRVVELLTPAEFA